MLSIDTIDREAVSDGRAHIANETRRALAQQEQIEQLGLVSIYAAIAQQFVEIGDTAGSDYALRRMGAHARAAIVAHNFRAGDAGDTASNGD